MIIRRGSSLNSSAFTTVPNPIKPRNESPIPNMIRNIICGILVLDENKATANNIAKNIGMRCSKERISSSPAGEELATRAEMTNCYYNKFNQFYIN